MLNYTQHFEEKTRTNGVKFICRKDGSPQDLGDIIYQVHQEFDALPNDWIYEEIYNALGGFEYGDSVEDFQVEPDCYTHDLLKWFQEPFAWGVCDEWKESMDATPKSILDWVTGGQWYARDKIYRMVGEWYQEKERTAD